MSVYDSIFFDIFITLVFCWLSIYGYLHLKLQIDKAEIMYDLEKDKLDLAKEFFYELNNRFYELNNRLKDIKEKR